jgi:hypothetical protein
MSTWDRDKVLLAQHRDIVDVFGLDAFCQVKNYSRAPKFDAVFSEYNDDISLLISQTIPHL